MIPREIQILLQRSKSITHFLQLHSLIIKSALDHDEYFISKYILSSSPVSLHFARFIFDTSPIIPPLFAWNTIIKDYSKSSTPIESIKLFSHLQSLQLKPDKFTFPFVIKACGRCLNVRVGGTVHSLIWKLGFDCDRYIIHTLLSFYANCSAIGLARQVFDEMSCRDVVSYTSMMAGYVACHYPVDALTVFQEMKLANENPNPVTLVSLLSACTTLLNIRLGKSIHSYIIISDIQLNVSLGTALIDMYAKCGHIEKALHIFNNCMRDKNLQSITVMISALADNSLAKEAISLFEKMENNGPKPDSMAFSSILSACSHLGLVIEGQKYFDRMVKVYNIRPTIEHYGCMVDVLGRAGMIEEAYEIIKNMPVEPNSVILRSFLGSCKYHEKHLCLDEKVKNLLIKIDPDVGANYVLASSLSSSSGCWSEADDLRNDMRGKGLKKVPGYSWLER